MANKWLIGGLILAGGVAGYFYLNKHQGQPASTPSSGGGGTLPSSSGTSTAPPITETSQDQQMRTQLLQWATGTQNVPLYTAWINQMTSSELANMYDILTNDWNKTGQATPQQAANWNALVKTYPFLQYAGVKDGVKCTNFNCN